MAGKTILYRGSLKSCNYHCSYCPFSRRRMRTRALETDREQWFSFVQNYMKRAPEWKVRALMVVPYGEVLIYPWYWEGLARISDHRMTDAVGAQTNLSFSIQESLAYFDRSGGDRKKLRLWATFHPEMTTAEVFSDKCKALADAGITLCAGAVGVPEHIGLIRMLRKKLPQDIYLWINRMDGLKRPYTKEEQEAFLAIDPCFLRELSMVPADSDRCRERLFVEGNGKMRTCNISQAFDTGWETFGQAESFPEPECSKKRCSCYLAYGGRDDFMNRILFGAYPVFRILHRPKAVFFDIEGTLLQRNKKGKQSKGTAYIPEHIMAGLLALSLEKIPLFFATTLPYQEAKKRCHMIWRLFSGGIFAGGAHLINWKKDREEFLEMEESFLLELMHLKQSFHFRILTYRNQGRIYKMTLCRASHNLWSQQEILALAETVSGMRSQNVRYFAEENCLQIVSAEANKANGVRKLCKWTGILPKEAAAAGNGEEDADMLKLCEM